MLRATSAAFPREVLFDMRVLTLAMSLSLALTAQQQTWTGYLSDAACSRQIVADHPVSCMKGCERSGFGIVRKDGSFLKFDADGNKIARQLLDETSKQKEVEVEVSGSIEGQTIRVREIKAR
jgi:hypothetical protein